MITLRDLSLQRGTKVLFENADVTLHSAWKVGITGGNGSGKSSLFALLRGELQADRGDCEVPRDWRIAHVAQESPSGSQAALDYVLAGDAELHEIQTRLAAAPSDGLELASLHARFEALNGYSAAARAAQVLSGLGFAAGEELKPIDAFSGGWRVRLNLARALMSRADLLLLDEPTNHLDLDAVMWFEDWLRRYDGTLLLISHDRDFLDSVCDHIIHIERRTVSLYSGNYSAFERRRAEQLAQQQAAHTRQQREISHIQQFVARFRAKASKAKQAQSRLKALERMSIIQAAHVDSPFTFTFPPPSSVPNPLLDATQINVGYADKTVLSQISFSLTPGLRIGLLGMNGAGKSTFIKLLAGELSPQGGELRAAKDLRIGYFAQHQMEQLDPQASPLLHLQRLSPQADEQSLRDFLGGFGFVGDMAVAASAPFSGGEKARLALALLVWQKPNLLLLDEPTNHLDLNMRDALALALQDFAGALVTVSHDRYLLRTVSDELWLAAEGRIQRFDGDLDDYRRWLEQQRAPAPSKSVGTIPKAQNQAQRAQRRQQESRLKKLEQQIERISVAKIQLEHELADPAIYQDHNKARQYTQRQTQLSAELEQIENEWLELSAELEV
jgi:ATP-binding cassette, subfamily F, member 3